MRTKALMFLSLLGAASLYWIPPILFVVVVFYTLEFVVLFVTIWSFWSSDNDDDDGGGGGDDPPDDQPDPWPDFGDTIWTKNKDKMLV